MKHPAKWPCTPRDGPTEPKPLRRPEHAVVRGGPPSPDGGVIADWTAPVDDPASLAALLDHDPGVVGHGLFGPELVSDVVVARDGTVRHDRSRPA